MNTDMKRKVVGTTTHYNPGSEKSRFVGGSRWLQLECGHELHQKLSRPVPRNTFCLECHRLSTGTGGSTHFDITARIASYETWDDAKHLPVKHTRDMTAAEIEYWCNPSSSLV